MLNHRVLISEGLGNQLFQYAFAHYLQTQNKTNVTVLNSPIVAKLGEGRSRDFALSQLLSNSDLLDFKRTKVISNYSIFGRSMFRLKLADRIFSIQTGAHKLHNCIETRKTSFKFFPSIGSDLGSDTLFRGFWQNWQYVLPNQEVINNEISLTLNKNVKNLSITRKHKKLLVMHIRRGDFLNRGRSDELGLITLDSYLKVLDSISQEDKNIDVVTFTDDIDLFANEENVIRLGKIFGPGTSDIWSILKFMSQADYMIAGNSTLSWWGSFLSFSNGGDVYIPKLFYKNLDSFEAFNYPGFNLYENDFIAMA